MCLLSLLGLLSGATAARGGCLLPGSKPEAPESKAGSRQRAAGCAGLCRTQATCSFGFHTSPFQSSSLGFPASASSVNTGAEGERTDVRVLREGRGHSSTPGLLLCLMGAEAEAAVTAATTGASLGPGVWLLLFSVSERSASLSWVLTLSAKGKVRGLGGCR